MWPVWAAHGWCLRMHWPKAIGRALKRLQERPASCRDKNLDRFVPRDDRNRGWLASCLAMTATGDGSLRASGWRDTRRDDSKNRNDGFFVIASEARQSMMRCVPRGDSQIDWIASYLAMTVTGGDVFAPNPEIGVQKNPRASNHVLQNTFVQV